jgi:hypothetical protein
MSERERWIVYPLLFLALGAGLRDKLIDRTLSKSIVCQELIVYGDDGAGRAPVKLVEIGAASRSSTTVPQVGQIFINGQLLAKQVRADAMFADNYFFHGIPFAPNVLRAIPGVLPADWLRALQQRASAVQGDAGAEGDESEPQTPPSEQPSSADNQD